MTKLAANHRRSIRLQAWDYSQEGLYFITICTHNREYLFGEIVEDLMHLNAPGEMVLQTREELPARFSVMELDAKVVMPNHFHAIVIIRRGEPCVRPERPESCIRPSDSPLPNVMQVNRDDLPEMGEHKVRPYRKHPWGTGPGSIGRIVQAFKSLTTHRYIQGIRESGWQIFKGKLWQRNYYERVIRDEEEWERISEYIAANPVNWAMDRENREGVKVKGDEPWQV